MLDLYEYVRIELGPPWHTNCESSVAGVIFRAAISTPLAGIFVPGDEHCRLAGVISSAMMLVTQKQLKSLTEGDEREARDTFNVIAPYLRGFTENYLRSRGVRGLDAEDITVMALNDVWHSRKKIQATTAASFGALIKRVAFYRSSRYFEGQKEGIEVAVEDLFESQEPSESPLPNLLKAAVQGDILHKADRLWLNSAGDSDSPLYHYALYVAQKRLFECQAMNTIAGIGCLADFKSDSDLDLWLKNHVELSMSIYRYLYVPTAELSCLLLGIDDRKIFKRLVQSIVDLDKSDNQFRSGEISVRAILVVERFFFNEPRTKIYSRYEKYIDREQFEEEYSDLRKLLPFPGRALRVAEYLNRTQRTGELDLLALCKRLVFQYHAIEYLGPEQIIELIADIADVFHCRINPDTLTNWLSRGRLYDELEKYLGEDV